MGPSSLVLRLVWLAACCAAVLLGTRAAPTRRDGTPTPASASEIASFIAPAKFASEAYCIGLTPGSQIGQDGTVLYAAGNGRDVQRVFIAHSPSIGIVLAYQGTNTSSIHSIENDVNAARTDADPRLAFLGDDVSIARGFQSAWADTADDVLNKVESALTQYPNAPLVITGHSLGASLALLSAAYVIHTIGPARSTRTVLFGLPRTGNQAFADAIDRFVPDQRHIVNYHDPIPHLPGKTLGYQHPSGEVWISTEDGKTVVDCPGQENENCAFSVHYYQYKESEHDGPYFGVEMGC